MWGGRFSEKPSDILQEMNASITFDQRLYAEDIAGSKAHCKMLVKQNIIPKEDGDKILQGLDQVLQEIESGNFTFKKDLEDIHMNVESRLSEIIGEAAGKLHTARSRNDQVATDFRLWLRKSIDQITDAQDALIAAFESRAAEHKDAMMPGFTHLQIAQPIKFATHMGAYVEMLKRDKARMLDARKRVNENPLGACALNGTSYPIDRAFTSTELGFDRPMPNTMDAVSSRDFALEFLSNAAICAMHLSRFAEEMVIWSNPLFGFIQLSDAFTTGSSIMPQKKNPDAAELIRAKPARIAGSWVTLLMVLKALPLTYNKDMQEDKEPVFDAVDTLLSCLKVMTGMVQDMHVNTDRMKQVANMGYATATQLADWLVQNLGTPFRQAHHITGSVVKYAESKGKTLPELTLEELQQFEPKITQDIFRIL